MKKFFSLVLALVMALSLTTIAWGADPAVIEVGADKPYKNLTAARDYAMTLTSATSVTYKIYGAVEVLTHTVDPSPYNGMHHGDFAFGPAGVPVVIEGADNAAKVAVIGGGVPDIVNTTFKNLTFADEGTYLPTANEFMYQNFKNCDFENVVFEDAPRLSGTCTMKGCTFNNATDQKYALWMDAGDFTIEDSAFVLADDGYGAVKSDATGSPLKLENNTFTNNSGSQKEALNTNGMVITATGNTFTDFTAGLLPADKTNTLNSETVTGAAADAAVKKSNATKLTGAVAKVGNNEYATVADAIAAANGAPVILLDDSATIPDGYTALANGTVVPTPAAGAVAPTLYVWDTAAKDWATYYIATGDDLDDLKLGADENCLPCYLIDGRYFVDTTEAAATYKLVYGATKLFLAPVDVTDVRYLDKATVFTNVTKETDECGKLVVTDTTKTYYVAYDEDNYDEDYYFVATKNGPIQLLVGGKIVDVAPNGAQDLTAHVWKGYDVVNNAYTTAKCENCGKVVKLYATGTAAGKGAHYEAGLGYITKIDNGFGPAVVTPSTDKVTSAETFDAGIAMYVGMSVMAAAGSVVVLKKKD